MAVIFLGLCWAFENSTLPGAQLVLKVIKYIMFHLCGALLGVNCHLVPGSATNLESQNWVLSNTECISSVLLCIVLACYV